jgi:hypothetical protein
LKSILIFVISFENVSHKSLSQNNLQNSNEEGAVFTKLQFLDNLKNGPNKLECYITRGWKGLLRTNTLAYEPGHVGALS